jgi:hypothetical protein
MLLNVGPSRADTLPGVEKIDMPSGSVMKEVATAIMCVYLAQSTLLNPENLLNFQRK